MCCVFQVLLNTLYRRLNILSKVSQMSITRQPGLLGKQVSNLLQCILSRRKRLYGIRRGCDPLSVSGADSKWLWCFVDMFDSSERLNLHTRISLDPWVRCLHVRPLLKCIIFPKRRHALSLLMLRCLLGIMASAIWPAY